MYNFETLSPKDFEELVRDLLQKELGVYLESFKEGRDEGIDLKYFDNSSDIVIIQCKHFKNSKLSNLKSKLKEEIVKIKKLQPKKYIIATSLSLTPKNKNEIISICSPYIISSSDIYGQDDLNNLIMKHPEVENNHFKLWMTSTNILKRIFNNDIINKSTFKLEEIQEKIKRFVPNLSLNNAKDILKEENFVVISGAPGVGKTTLAQMLIWEYVTKEYEFINISEDINEAFKLYNPNTKNKQIFYYDDFLGQTQLTKNEDERLLTFINKINKSKNKKLILTTREYILQETKLLYEKIDNFDFKKCVIDLKQYTNQIKAEILYNHLYFSDLPPDYINSIINNENYFKIIKHANYNPRIIEYMTKQNLHKNMTADVYFNTFINNLNNPSQIWNHVFENQLDNKARSVLFAIVTYDKDYLFFDKIDIKNDAQLICQYLYSEKLTELDYKKTLKILIGDFIHTNINYLEFANPSVKDFLENYIKGNNLLSDFMEICRKSYQYSWFYYAFIAYKKIDKKYPRQLFNKLKTANSDKYSLKNTELMINLIIDIGDRDLIQNLEEELNYIIEHTHTPYNNQDSFFKLRFPIFKNNKIVINFLNKVAQSIIENLNYINDIDDYLNIATFIDDHQDFLNEQDIEKIKNYINDKFEDLKENAIENNYYSDELEDARDKLEEINDKLELLKDLEDIEDVIAQLEEQEEAEAQQDEEKTLTYNNETSFINLTQEEKNIRNLFRTLKNNCHIV